MFSRGISTELRWLLLTVLGALIVGFGFDAVQNTLIAALFLYILWFLYRIKELETWVTEARRKLPPADDFGGVWGEIADDVRLLCKRYEKDKIRLQAVVERVQEMTSALTDAVILVDSRANIEWWNRAAFTLFRFQDVDRGHNLVNIIRHPAFVHYFESEDYENPLELESLRKEGEKLQFHVHPFGHGERLVVIRDITRVKRLEQMRKDFVSNVSHELRTPLTVIKGYIETLMDAPNVPKAWQNALSQMKQQSDRMTALVNDLITLSRMETDEQEQEATPVAIGPMIRSIVADAESISEENLSFQLSGDIDIQINGNDRELHSIISNLIFNAVKYSPNGGEVSVSVSVDNRECIVQVQDQGLGIDPKHLPRITERFYRVDEGRSTAMGGTGLGLAIVKHALARHDAELKVKSRLGRGSTFSCHFPLTRLSSQKAA
ncbi:MAG: phosphate regulon sensor histidine kinase PhoR [Agarilytica sp.]